MIIAIEGIDAAGKNTQSELLKRRVQNLGFRTEILAFPRYGQTLFSSTIADYLNGRFGDLQSVDPHFSSLLYAGDRFESRSLVLNLSKSTDWLIIDRYVASNLAYQAARISPEDRLPFIEWLSRIEYGIYGLPRADLTVYLDIPVEHALKLLRTKKQRTYTQRVADIYENDARFLGACREVYQTLATDNFESKWLQIQCCTHDGLVRNLDEISDSIWKAIQSVVGGNPSRPV